MTSTQVSPDKVELIALRKELLLSSAPLQEGGAPSWTIEDPVRNLFFRIGRKEMELLARWDSGDGHQLIQHLKQETGLETDVDEIVALQQFLLTNSLLTPRHPRVQSQLEQMLGKQKRSWFSWLIHNYIFFRISLWQPDTFLERTLFLVKPLASVPALCFYTIIALFSLVLLTPQWSSFFSTFPYFFSAQGMLSYTVSIFFVKFLHELGHAYTAKAYGLRVPSMGVALIVLWPMLYSDSSDSWKVKDRSVRMKIVAAGMLTELIVAAFATFGWCVLQPGILKSTCFVLATSSWVHSLFINLTPFMRFDGYYLLSDFIEVPNLASRSFALGRWRLRRFLLGLDTGQPEPFSPRLERLLLLYCYATWIYRILLFTGIALMVYHLFFKALGVFLFAVEIYIFVIMPIVKEIKVWWSQRSVIGCNGRMLISAVIAVVLLTIVVLPLPTRVVVPAVLMAQQTAAVFPPFAAQVEAIHIRDDMTVEQGDLLYSLTSANLAAKQELLNYEVTSLQAQLQRELSSKKNIDGANITANMLAAALSKLHGYDLQRQRLNLYAPIRGKVTHMLDGLVEGSWLRKDQRLCLIVGSQIGVIEGYIKEGELQYLSDDTGGFFVAESGDCPSIPCDLTEIDLTVDRSLQAPELASTVGGQVAVIAANDASQPPQLTESRFRIRCDISAPLQIERRVRGYVVFKGKPSSLLYRMWLGLAPGLVRESGW